MSYYQELMAKVAAKANSEYGIVNDGDFYKDIDGHQILHCKQCGEPKQQIMFVSLKSAQEIERDMDEYAIKHRDLSRQEVEKAVMSIMPPKAIRRDIGLVGVPCKCQRDYKDGITKAEKDMARKQHIENNLRECFPVANMRLITFDRYESNKHLLKAQGYERKFADMLKDGKGFVFCGKSGAGKTIAAICLANALLQREFKVLFRVQQEIVFTTVDQRQELTSDLISTTVLIIDDFNLSTCSDYGKEFLFYIIDQRVSAGKPTIITTNCTKQLLKNANGADKRLYDRICASSYIVEDSTYNYRK